MLTTPDFKELLNLLKKNQGRYLVVGGYAVMKYTEPRFTKDLDLLIATDPENAQSVYQSLKEFGAPLKNLSERDFTRKGYFYKMGQSPLRVDVMMSIPGVEFEEAWKRREKQTIDGIDVYFISKADLIASKRAAARPQDLIDLAALEQD